MDDALEATCVATENWQFKEDSKGQRGTVGWTPSTGSQSGPGCTGAARVLDGHWEIICCWDPNMGHWEEFFMPPEGGCRTSDGHNDGKGSSRGKWLHNMADASQLTFLCLSHLPLHLTTLLSPAMSTETLAMPTRRRITGMGWLLPVGTIKA